ncbi:hypothetical protein, partial [Bacillus thuringiensis]|uniref:hypothetical protein n=1 Tax=Bacillus thuringiensis TaxID=1428 RepID=UPI00197AACD2
LTHKKRFRHKNRLGRRLSPQPEKTFLYIKRSFGFYKSILNVYSKEKLKCVIFIYNRLKIKTMV